MYFANVIALFSYKHQAITWTKHAKHNFLTEQYETRKIRTPPFWDTPRRLKYKINT